MATIVSREVLLLINAYGEACKAAVRAESAPADLPAAQDAELVACGRLVQAVSQPVSPRSADATDVLRIDFPPGIVGGTGKPFTQHADLDWPPRTR